jgi:hypothetical protein
VASIVSMLIACAVCGSSGTFNDVIMIRVAFYSVLKTHAVASTALVYFSASVAH